ncbi:MAG: acyltransferase family protein [Lachnospiraceae bacterium]|nr:acyltransferase family protein [Lachnospiraceae bacterium]
MNAYPKANLSQNQTAVDPFRALAALLIVAIHTAPLSSFNETADFLFSYCFGRIAVPFFLMTTGYFVLGAFLTDPKLPLRKLLKSMRKTVLLYLAATLLYLPVNIYSGKLPAPKDLLKALVFDGTFYHLWYLPAALLGMLLVFLLAKICRPRAVFLICAFLYLIGLMGDSWYGLIAGVSPIKTFYDGLFQISSYTRNGIFYAPIFLFLGAQISRTRVSRRSDAAVVYLISSLVSLILMLGEGYLSFSLGFQRHNSMYLFLVPCMYFLFLLLLCLPGKNSPFLRKVTLLVYLLHPLVIILVRGFAKVTRLSAYLVENSLLHYLAVCAGSFAAAFCLSLLQDKIHQRRHSKIYHINL